MIDDSRPRFASVTEMADSIGAELGRTPWIMLDQARVRAFSTAASTDSLQEGRLPVSFVPPWMVLACLSPLVKDLYEVTGVAARINYGTESVTFDRAVAIGTRVRANATVVDATSTPVGHRLTLRLVMHAETHDDPLGYADTVAVFVGGRD